MKRFKWCMIVWVGCFFVSIANAQLESQQNPAVIEAAQWLNLLDQKNFDRSAQITSPIFSQNSNFQVEADYLSSMRRPFGRVLNRELTRREVAQRLPGFNKGHYQVLLFKTIFERKKIAYEVVNLHLDDDQQWRVSGYYIR